CTVKVILTSHPSPPANPPKSRGSKTGIENHIHCAFRGSSSTRPPAAEPEISGGEAFSPSRCWAPRTLVLLTTRGGVLASVHRGRRDRVAMAAIGGLAAWDEAREGDAAFEDFGQQQRCSP